VCVCVCVCVCVYVCDLNTRDVKLHRYTERKITNRFFKRYVEYIHIYYVLPVRNSKFLIH